MTIELRPLQKSEEDEFIRENQIAFDKAAIEEFGPQEKSVIPRQDIENSLHKTNAEAFRIIADGKAVGGVIVVIDPETNVNSLDILFLDPECHSRGIGLKVWRMIESKYPETQIWETHTPYFEKRNIHFYVNKCGFHIVEFFNPHHPEPCGPCDTPGGEYFFRFEKVMKQENLQ